MTNTTDIGSGVILYDGACGICNRGARRFERLLRRRDFRLLPLQSPQALKLSGATTEQLLTEVHLVTPAHQTLRGVDAILYVARAIPWARPIGAVARLPGILPIARLAYRRFAQNRYRISGACGIGARDSALARWLPAIALVAAAMIVGPGMPAWAFMWTLALAMFYAAKWITWYPHRRLGSRARNVAYLLPWTGMDAASFLDPARRAPAPSARDIGAGLLSMACGLAILAMLPGLSFAPPAGLVALVLILHFGLFHLLAAIYQSFGVDARPLMDRPARSRSLAEFWGRRWNSGFVALADQTLFVPLRRTIRPVGATAIVFLASGLIHDAVISLPARGGYGLPTLYFVIQLAGLLVERTRPMRRLSRTWTGWLYTIAFTLVPLPLLFHGPFLRNVMLPFLHTIGVLS